MIATDDFPRIYRGKSRSHRVVGVPEPALLTAQRSNQKLGEGFIVGLICGTSPVEVKVKMQEAANVAGESRNEAAKSRRNRAKA